MLYGGLSIADLQTDTYHSYLRNKLVAEAFYLTGTIEKYGSGFVRIRRELERYPDVAFAVEEQDGGFLLTYSLSGGAVTPHVTGQVTGQVTGEVTGEVFELMRGLARESRSRKDLQQALGLKSEANFRERYLEPALAAGRIEMTIPDKPNSRLQRYRLTAAGRKALAVQDKK